MNPGIHLRPALIAGTAAVRAGAGVVTGPVPGRRHLRVPRSRPPSCGPRQERMGVSRGPALAAGTATRRHGGC